MDDSQLLQAIDNGEDSKNQFKVNITSAKSLAAEIVALANAQGGTIYIGVDNQGQIPGLDKNDIDRLNQMISNVCTNNVKPAITVFTEIIPIKDKKILIISLLPGIDKPYADQDGIYWVKSGADKRKVVREKLLRIFQEADKLYADEMIVNRATIDDFNIDKFKNFYKAGYNKELADLGLSLKQLLNNLNFSKGDNLTLAGLLLFGKHFEKFHRPYFELKAVNFAGNDISSSQFHDKENFKGTLMELFWGGMKFCYRNLRKVQVEENFNSQGVMEQKIPIEESLVNALIHRNYFIDACIRLFIFDNRIEIISPGSLPNSLTVENIKQGNTLARNPILNSFATKLLPYTGLGSGIIRILKEEPNIEFINDAERELFIVKIPRKNI